MNKAERDELRRLAEAATPGPWRVELDSEGQFIYAEACPSECDPELWDGCVAVLSGPRETPDADAALIVAAVNALPALLDQLDTLETATSEEALAHGLADIETPLNDAVGFGPWDQMKPVGWRWYFAAAALRAVLGLDQ